jgi:hypothetical protein
MPLTDPPRGSQRRAQGASSMSIRLFALAIVPASIGLLATGCAALANMNAVSAENPLKSPSRLAWSKKAEGVPFEGQQACTVWPLESRMSVNATSDQICIQATMTRIAGSGIDGSKPSSLHATSDGSQESKGGMAGQFTNSVEGQAQKVGTCVDKTRRVLNVWVATYDGCVPNEDMKKQPVLTPDSTYLSVGGARWKFPTAAPAAPSAAPASSSASAR